MIHFNLLHLDFLPLQYKVPTPGRAKKTVPKPKTANAVVAPTASTENSRYPEREKAAYSSPPSFMDNRNASRKNKGSYMPRRSVAIV